MIKKTTIILLAVFCTSYVWLNFDFAYYELGSIASMFQKTNNTDQVNLISDTKTYLFPISQNKKEESKTFQIETSSIVSLASSFRLSIPTLNVQAPVVFEPTIIEKRIYSALEKGVVHYTQTPQPGQPGTAIILGHSSSYPWYKGKYGSVFAQLYKLNQGDVINIEKEGQILRYQVTKSIIFSPKTADDYALRELESTTGSSLVLMTCWPTGTNSKRVAVRADLII